MSLLCTLNFTNNKNKSNSFERLLLVARLMKILSASVIFVPNLKGFVIFRAHHWTLEAIEYPDRDRALPWERWRIEQWISSGDETRYCRNDLLGICSGHSTLNDWFCQISLLISDIILLRRALFRVRIVLPPCSGCVRSRCIVLVSYCITRISCDLLLFHGFFILLELNTHLFQLHCDENYSSPNLSGWCHLLFLFRVCLFHPVFQFTLKKIS